MDTGEGIRAESEEDVRGNTGSEDAYHRPKIFGKSCEARAPFMVFMEWQRGVGCD